MSGVKSTLLVINSAGRSSNSASTSDFQYDIGQPLAISQLILKSASIPVTQYNILYPNNGIAYYVNDNIHLITIPEGQYSTNQIVALIVPLFLSQAGLTMTITQNAYTGILTFASVIPFRFVQGSETIYRLLTVLGLPTADTGYVTSLTFSTIPNLSGLKNYYILTKVLSSGSYGLFNSGVQDALQSIIPITEVYGGNQIYMPHVIENDIITFSRPINIQNLDIKIVDSNLQPVNLNGSNIELIYKLWH